MKKHIYLYFLIILIIVFTGCSYSYIEDNLKENSTAFYEKDAELKDELYEETEQDKYFEEDYYDVNSDNYYEDTNYDDDYYEEEHYEEEYTEVQYIGNSNTAKFHYPYCSSVGQMKEKNKVYFYCSRDEIIYNGFIPCKRCNP